MPVINKGFKNKIKKNGLLNLIYYGIFNANLRNQIEHYSLFHYFCSNRNPKTFAEVMIARMGSQEFRKLSKYADKYEVRSYIRDTIGEEFLIPLIDCFENVDCIHLDEIQNYSCLKANHGSGFTCIFDKSKPFLFYIEKMNSWMKTDYSLYANELQYKDIPHKIIIENNISPDRKNLIEYSFFTFNGTVEFVRIYDHSNCHYEIGRYYESLPFQLFTNDTVIPPKPSVFDQLVKLSEELAKPFGFVRVDFFVCKQKIYFGELTFSPYSGLCRFEPKSYNNYFGEKLKNTIIIR